jgi:hypothetical protein
MPERGGSYGSLNASACGFPVSSHRRHVFVLARFRFGAFSGSMAAEERGVVSIFPVTLLDLLTRHQRALCGGNQVFLSLRSDTSLRGLEAAELAYARVAGESKCRVAVYASLRFQLVHCSGALQSISKWGQCREPLTELPRSVGFPLCLAVSGMFDVHHVAALANPRASCG